MDPRRLWQPWMAFDVGLLPWQLPDLTPKELDALMTERARRDREDRG